MKRSSLKRNATLSRKANALRQSLRRRAFGFAREEDGAMIIFGIMIFGLMLAIGGLSFDLMRFEANRERLQSTLDRAVLAAASLQQTLPPRQVVLDYFAKAGMSEYIDPDDIHVTEGISSRRVQASAKMYVPLHHGAFGLLSGSGGSGNSGDVLIAEAGATAEESIGNVEISMVLDMSGSMNESGRLGKLKDAAREFVDIVYDSADANTVSTSIIPYATQVNAGEKLLEHYTRTSSHDYSHCVNFSANDYTTASLPTNKTLEQTLHFDFYTGGYSGWRIGSNFSYFSCKPQAAQRILPWASSKQTLKTYITNLTARGYTSTDVGVKWGAALLDSSTSSVLTSLANSGDVHTDMRGRPFAYNDPDAMKIMIVMTDGAHTRQYYMNNFRTGNSFVWKKEDPSGVVHYSVWSEGLRTTPDTNPSAEWVCTRYRWGRCRNWDHRQPKKWFHIYNMPGGPESTQMIARPYGSSGGTVGGSRMTWDEVWATFPPAWFSDSLLQRMGTLTNTERAVFKNAMTYLGQSPKDDRLDKICDAMKDNDVIVFAVGLLVTTSNANKLTKCASSPSHYYNVTTLNIEEAFKEIASNINQLRLTQ